MTETDFYADESLELGEGRPEEPKGQYDRYILPRGDGQAMEYTRTTTLVGTVDSGVGLGIWRKYRAAWGVAQRDDLINRLRAVPVDDHTTIREICDKAELIAGTDAGANDGTAAHAVLQRVDQGEAIEAIHPYYHPLVRNYQAELARLGITVLPQYVERTCRCARLDAGGKPDNIYQLDDGSLVIGDKKTTADMIKAERAIAAQLGIYANCEHMFNYVTGRYEPMPPVRKDFALIILIDTDTWEVTIESINIEYGWARTRLMVELRESNKVKGLRHPYLPGGRWNLKPKTVLPSTSSAYAGQVDTWNAQGQPMLDGQHPCGDCGAPDYITGPHTAQCSQNPANIAAYEAGRNGYDPGRQRSAESVARVAAIANGVLDAAHQRVAVHHPEGLIAEHGVVTSEAVTQAGPVGVLDASPTPQAATTPTSQPPTTVGPHANTTPPPTPSDYPVVDPTARVQEIMDVRKNDKTRLQHWAKALGCTDLAHHRKWLAEWIVAATPGSGAIEPSGEGDTGPGKFAQPDDVAPSPAHLPGAGNPQTLAQTGLPPAPAEPPGQSVVGPSIDHPVQDNTPEVLAHKAANAASLDVLRAVWKTYTDTYGPDSWETSGPVKAAADARADFIKRQLAGDDGPPF